MWTEHLLLTPILALVQQVVSIPLVEHSIEKRKATWGPTEYRHHEWHLPKQITCIWTNGEKKTYDVDQLELMTWGAHQYWLPNDYDHDCDLNIQCYEHQVRFNEKADVKLQFDVKDDVPNVGQVIQYYQMFFMTDGSKVSDVNCTGDDGKWTTRKTGKANHKDSDQDGPKPPPLTN